MKSRFLVIIFLSYRAFSFLCSMYPITIKNKVKYLSRVNIPPPPLRLLKYVLEP